MILKTDFQRSGAGKLLKYIRRDRDADREKVPLRNRLGREVDEQRIEQFIEKSEQFGFQRHFIVSPDPDAEFTPEEVQSNTREFMKSAFDRQPTTDYVYAVHTDTEIVHSHVAATGSELELRMDADDIKQLRSRASDVFDEPERLKTKTAKRDAESVATDTGAERVQERDRVETADLDAVEQIDQEAAPERDFDFGGGR
ncbi:relaxase/mobilization nuclease domain-containing protein [Haloarcula amylovorans]|uniref:relaxase/mobilization nuclease domain-containing protein n=1 Tax=Haloarcula amylovorans TaxID=2562280 RepID=UPI0010766124|nr:relaxase/mobilization nuclease domain-containing protein [Halomicroarcula amylolytica]